MFPIFGSTIPNGPGFYVMEGAGAASISEDGGSIQGAPLKSVCAYCEESWQGSDGHLKSEVEKKLEDIAVDYFKRRVLRVEEITLNDTSSIMDDVTRCCQLLNSVVLCESCIFKFCKTEANVLKDQKDYLDKMTGPKEFSEMLADPWLDLKRYAFAKLKSQQSSILEKLSLIEAATIPERGTNVTVSNAEKLSSLKARYTSTPEPPVVVSKGQQVLNYPISTVNGNNSNNLDINTGTHTKETVPPAATCQYAATSSASNSSRDTTPHNNQTKNGVEKNTNGANDTFDPLSGSVSIRSPSVYGTPDESEHEHPLVIDETVPLSKPSENQLPAESEREKIANSDCDETESIKSASVANNVRSTRNTPVKSKVSRKTSEEPEPPKVKRAKLNNNSSEGLNADALVFAKKSAPPTPDTSPIKPTTAYKKKITAAKTPKDNPRNKPSKKTSVKAAVKASETAPLKSVGSKGKATLPSTPKKKVLVGDRMLSDSDSSSDDSDSSSDSSSDE